MLYVLGIELYFFPSDAVFLDLEDSGVRKRGKVEFEIQRMTNKCILDPLLPLRLPDSLSLPPPHATLILDPESLRELYTDKKNYLMKM